MIKIKQKIPNNNKFLFYNLYLVISILLPGSEVISFEIDNINSKAEENLYATPIRKVFNSFSSGTGQLIGIKDGNCSILTANHVVEDHQSSEIEVLISPKKSIAVNSIIRPFNDKDLAILKIKCSSVDKKYLNLAILPFINDELWENLTPNNDIDIEGIVAESEMIKKPQLRHVKGEFRNFLSEPKDGYNMFYEANTAVGMSGSPIYMHTDTAVQLIDPSSKNPSYSYKKDGFGVNRFYKDYSIAKNNTKAENYALQRCLEDPFFIPINDSRNYQVFMEGEIDNYKSDSEIINKYSYKRFISKGLSHEEATKKKEELIYKLKKNHCFKIASNTVLNCPRQDQSHNLKPFLVGIHGRSESYEYGGKSGYAFGTFLGDKKIRKWFKENSKELGLANKDSWAWHICNNNVSQKN